MNAAVHEQPLEAYGAQRREIHVARARLAASVTASAVSPKPGAVATHASTFITRR